VHFGRKSYFRGFLPFIARSALLTASVRATEVGASAGSFSWGYNDSLSVGLGLLGYALLYPLEIIQLHMSVEVEQRRFYPSARECLSKIKRNHGLKTLYRGFFYGSGLFALQLAAIKYALKQVESEGQTCSEWERMGRVVGLVGASELLFYPLLTIKYRPF
jgi:hypothetical protein